MIVTVPTAKILGIADRGNLEMERVHIEIVSDCNLSSLIVLATVPTDDGRIYAGSRPAYWFPDQSVKTGDHIILSTKAGNVTQVLRPDGRINYFCFWGAKNPLFGGRARVIVAELNTWQTGG
jgi:hypothetical protein